MEIVEYLNKGEHLPDFMKDFHDQKDLFKAIYTQWHDGHKETLNNVSWVDAQCFTIDFFLWWMAIHGYKLQKIKKKDIAFYSAKETIAKYKKERDEEFFNILNKHLKSKS